MTCAKSSFLLLCRHHTGALSQDPSLPEPQAHFPLPLWIPEAVKSLLFQLGTCPCRFPCPFLSPTCSQGLLN